MSSFPLRPFCVLLSAFAAVTACSRKPELPDYGVVPSFTMTDSNGHEFQSSQLQGKVWAADFIYTSCPAECPMMSSKMHKIEKQIAGDNRLALVSFSVDPQRDTPPVLDAFARRYGGANQQWTFLTGRPATIHQLAYVTFHVGDVIDKMTHSTKFTLVDGRGHIRGYYSSLGVDELDALVRDMRALASN